MDTTRKPRLSARHLLWSAVVASGLVAIRWWFGYPVFHSIAELFAIAVAFGTFMITWNARHYIDNGYLLLLGIAYFFVASIDALHMLSYQGVEMFAGYSATELPTQLWLAARYLQALTLLIAPAFIDRRTRPEATFVLYLVATVLLVVAVFSGLMPSAFPETGALTPFKIWSEWAVSAAFVAGLFGLYVHRKAFDRVVYELLAWSMATTVAAELCFMLYGTPQAAANLIGHLLRILAYFLLYRALIVTSITRPHDVLFRQLKQTSEELARSETRFRSTFENATVGIAHMSLDGKWLLANRRMAEITGYALDELFEHSPAGITYDADRASEADLNARLISGDLDEYHVEKRFVRPSGEIIWVNLSSTLVRESAATSYFVLVAEEISARKHAEERLRRANDLSEALSAINRAINSTFDSGEVMRRVASLGTAVIEADAATVWVQDDGAWTPRMAHGYSNQIVNQRFSDADVPHIAECIKLGAPVSSEDFADRYPDGVSSRVEDHTIKSALAIPLQFRGAQYGALTFVWRDQPHAFTRAELDFAQKLGAALALAMDNARLYEIERRIADTLQASMLGVDEEIAGIDVAWAYRSATELTRIGGDFFDVFALDDGRISFVIGDVAGKGIEAAALTSIAKSTIRSFAYELHDPATVAAAANRSIMQQVKEGHFITAVYGLLDPRTGGIRFVVAGHPLPLVCDELGCTEQAATHNPPLGVFIDWDFEVYDVQLHAGQRVILFTDGLLDARSGSEFFGDARVHQIVDDLGDADPQIVVDRLMLEARRMAGGSPADDIAILAFRYTGT